MRSLETLEDRQTIMLADDEIANLEFLSSILEKDFRVIGIMRGESAVEEAAKYQQSLILLKCQH